MAVSFNWYDISTQFGLDGTWEAGSPQISIASQPIYLGLLTSSYTFSAGHTLWGTSGVSSNEIANGNGYVTNGLALSSLALTQAAPVSNFTAANAVWTASGGSIAAWQYAVAYIRATVNGHLNPLLFVINAGAVIGPTTTGNPTGVNWNGTGVFQQAHS
jgi:hypothetical protein